MKYVYPAIFYAANEGGYYVEFPDVEGALTQGETLFEAMEMAEDALCGMLVSWENGEEMTNKIHHYINFIHLYHSKLKK